MPFKKSRTFFNQFTRSRTLFDVFTHHARKSIQEITQNQNHAITQENKVNHTITQPFWWPHELQTIKAKKHMSPSYALPPPLPPQKKKKAQDLIGEVDLFKKFFKAQQPTPLTPTTSIN